MLSVEEVTLLLRAAPAPKYKAAFSVAYGAGCGPGGCRAQGLRHQLQAHDASGRTGQRPQEPALAKAGDRFAMLSPQLLELLRDWWGRGRGAACCCREAGCSQAATRSSRNRPASSTAPSMPPPRLRGSKACRRTRCGTASPPICSSRTVDIRVIQRSWAMPSSTPRRFTPARRQYHDPCRNQPTRPARTIDRGEAATRRLAGRPCAARGWRSQTSFIAMEPTGVAPMPDM